MKERRAGAFHGVVVWAGWRPFGEGIFEVQKIPGIFARMTCQKYADEVRIRPMGLTRAVNGAT